MNQQFGEIVLRVKFPENFAGADLNMTLLTTGFGITCQFVLIARMAIHLYSAILLTAIFK
jgi:hypothetical protein